MTAYKVTFTTDDGQVSQAEIPSGTLLVEAARLAGVDIGQPCGGQGRCGRCIVQVVEGKVRRRSELRLSSEDVVAGFALACQTVAESDVTVSIPRQETVARRLTSDRTAADVKVPDQYNFQWSQTIRRYNLTLSPPSMDDQTDDWSRLTTALRTQTNIQKVNTSIAFLQKIGAVLRDGDWRVHVILDTDADEPEAPARMIDLRPGHFSENDPLWAVAIDIGTTTVSLWLVDLVSGQAKAQVAEYNGQIARGEDVISRIIYAGKSGGDVDMQSRVVNTINGLLDTASKRARTTPDAIVKATIVGNSTMIHLLLKIPPASIRLSPFITAVNNPPLTTAHELGVNLAHDATVDCLPGVASYVGADITAGVLSSGTDATDEVTLFLDVGTNGEIVLGNRDWLVTCACSAGPAFEGAGVHNGMRATDGAIEETWINGQTLEPTYRVIGSSKPRGICGSGLISLMAEMFLTGLLDKGGNINMSANTNRVRQGEHGSEYVVAWADETATDEDIVIRHVDVDNLLRAKAAIYAGYHVLAEQVGVPMETIQKMLVGGSFGKYINVEKAVQIGLLPDMPWERFEFLGNTAVKGAYFALLDRHSRDRVQAIAERMTYIELSADNTFYEAFMSAMFLPHTDLLRFPSVAAILESK